VRAWPKDNTIRRRFLPRKSYCPGAGAPFILVFSNAVQRETQPNLATILGANKDLSDPLAPRREAALFYGLFLRGHNIEALRKDIDVPTTLVKKWMTGRQYSHDDFRDKLRALYYYRKQVLAIFDQLVLNEPSANRLQ
jgi:hypothetical protein